MASLTEQLDALIAKHDLSSITITRLSRRDGTGFWSINAQCKLANDQREIGSSDHETADVGAALAEAIDALNLKRITPAEVLDLAPMQVAA